MNNRHRTRLAACVALACCAERIGWNGASLAQAQTTAASRPSTLGVTDADRGAVSRLLFELMSHSGLDPLDILPGESAAHAERELDKMGERAVGPLIEFLKSPTIGLRMASANELGRMKCKGAVQPLTSLLDSAQAGDTLAIDRVAAARSLGAIGDPAAAKTLVDHLGKDAVPSVRVACAQALARSGDKDCEAQLLHAMIDDHDPIVRAACAETLAGAPPSRQCIDAFKQALADESGAAGWAAIGLAQLGLADGVPQLLVNLASLRSLPPGEPLRKLRVQVIQLLGRLADRRALEILDQMSQSDDDDVVRREAAAAAEKCRVASGASK